MIYVKVRHLPEPSEELAKNPIGSLYDSIALSLRGAKAASNEVYDPGGLTVSQGVQTEFHDRAIAAGADKAGFAIMWMLKGPQIDESLQGMCAAIADEGFIRQADKTSAKP